jgi:adenylate cyclase class 2
MQTEIEAKFINVDIEAIRQKLKDEGATLVEPERLMKRQVFDYPDHRLEAIGGWVRVRDEGNKITMSYKQLNDRTLHGTKEVTLAIDDYKMASSFLDSIGLIVDSYQETKRESWKLDDVEIEIDTWPWIPSFVELEAHSEESIKAVAQKLGFYWKDAMHGSVETAYQNAYDVTEEEIDNWDLITFVPVPDWLEQKRKK